MLIHIQASLLKNQFPPNIVHSKYYKLTVIFNDFRFNHIIIHNTDDLVTKKSSSKPVCNYSNSLIKDIQHKSGYCLFYYY